MIEQMSETIFQRRMDGAKRNPPTLIAVDCGGLRRGPHRLHPPYKFCSQMNEHMSVTIFQRRVDGAKRNPPVRIAVDSGGNSTASIHPTSSAGEARALREGCSYSVER